LTLLTFGCPSDEVCHTAFAFAATEVAS